MKVKIKGKKIIEVTMTLNQLASILAALDFTAHGSSQSIGNAYRDVEKVLQSLLNAIDKSEVKIGGQE